MPTKLLERIFEPFFCVGKARDHESGGYGIGLAITARVVALHGGSVRARNVRRRRAQSRSTITAKDAERAERSGIGSAA